jgi:hypothetical protein
LPPLATVDVASSTWQPPSPAFAAPDLPQEALRKGCTSVVKLTVAGRVHPAGATTLLPLADPSLPAMLASCPPFGGGPACPLEPADEPVLPFELDPALEPPPVEFPVLELPVWDPLPRLGELELLPVDPVALDGGVNISELPDPPASSVDGLTPDPETVDEAFVDWFTELPLQAPKIPTPRTASKRTRREQTGSFIGQSLGR